MRLSLFSTSTCRTLICTAGVFLSVALPAAAKTILVSVNSNIPSAIKEFGFLDKNGNPIAVVGSFQTQNNVTTFSIQNDGLAGVKKFCVKLKPGFHVRDRAGKRFPVSCESNRATRNIKYRYKFYRD